MMQFCRKVSGFQNYFVSADGDVFSAKMCRGHKGLLKLNPWVGSDGYLTVALFDGARKFNKRIHRLVLETFVGSAPDDCEGSHLDGNKLNNCLLNLVWESKHLNHSRKTEHGTDHKGERAPLAKLTWAQVAEIRAHIASGRELTKIAIEYGVSQPTISGIKHNKTWKLEFHKTEEK